MISKVLKVGDRVEMKRCTISENPDEKPRLYNSQLIDIKDENSINVSIPIEGGKIIPLELGGRYELRFVTTSGIYMCKAEIANRCKQGNIYFLVMHVLSELHKDQRRQYFRLDKIKPMEYHKVSGEENELFSAINEKHYKDDLERRVILNKLKDTNTDEQEGTLSNISGGGIKFYSRDGLQAGDTIRIKLYLEDSDTEPLDLFARVVASEYVQNNTLHNEHRIEFVNINRDTREKIVKYVFNEDRKQRQKEKGVY